MEATNITPAMSINGRTLTIEGWKPFEMPKYGCNDYISVVAMHKEEKHMTTVFLGSGSCCHGHVFSVTFSKNRDVASIYDVVAVPTNVRAILLLHSEKRGVVSKTYEANLMLVAGSGCDGNGVWLIDPYKGTTWPIRVEATPSWERGSRTYYKARFRIDGERVFVQSDHGEIELTEVLADYEATPLVHETVVQEYRFPA